MHSRGPGATTCCAVLHIPYFLPHLPSSWHVEDNRVLVICFGHDSDIQCVTMDEALYSIVEKVQNFAIISLVEADVGTACCDARRSCSGCCDQYTKACDTQGAQAPRSRRARRRART